MKNTRIVLQIDIEADSYRDDVWRYRIRVNGKVLHRGRGTPEDVMELAKQALREAGR